MISPIVFLLQTRMKSGKNHMQITRAGRHFPKAGFVAWRADVERQIVRQVPLIRTFTEPVHVTLRYTPGDLLRRDAPGVMDALWHVLERVRLVKDDALIQSIDYRQLPLDRAKPGCLVTLQAANFGGVPVP